MAALLWWGGKRFAGWHAWCWQQDCLPVGTCTALPGCKAHRNMLLCSHCPPTLGSWPPELWCQLCFVWATFWAQLCTQASPPSAPFSADFFFLKWFYDRMGLPDQCELSQKASSLASLLPIKDSTARGRRGLLETLLNSQWSCKSSSPSNVNWTQMSWLPVSLVGEALMWICRKHYIAQMLHTRNDPICSCQLSSDFIHSYFPSLSFYEESKQKGI